MWAGARGPPADLDRLAERIEITVAERIPDMAVVEAAGPPRLRGQRRELLGRREGRRADSPAPS